MDIAESRLSAMESIGENLLRADNILKNEDRGIISDIYDLYKNFMNDDLSSRNVSYAVTDEAAGLLALNSANAGLLTKRDYYIESKERMIRLTMARLRRSNIKIDEARKKEIYEDVERSMRLNLEQVKDLSRVSRLKQMVLNADDASFERLINNYVRQAEQINQPRSPEDKTSIRQPMPEFTASEEYNTSDPVTFEEVYLNERGVGFSPENIERFDRVAAEMSVAQGAYNKYQSFVRAGSEVVENKDPNTLAEGIEQLYHNFYAASPQDNAAEINLQQAINDSETQCRLFRDSQNNIRIDTSAYSEPAAKRHALQKVLEAGRTRQEQQLNKVLNGKPLGEYINNYRQNYQRALGSQSSARLAEAMVNDNIEVIDRVSNVGAAAGMTLTVVGGVVAFVAPPAAPLGMMVSKAGTGISVASMGARSIAGYTEALTRDNVDYNEIIGRNKDLAMDIAGFAIGSAAGATGGKLAKNLINNGSGRVAAMIADKGTDYTLSLAGDLAMMGALQLQQNVGDLAENNLMGLAVSSISGIRHGLRHGQVQNAPSDVLGLKRVVYENGHYQVTSTRDIEREQIASRNRQQAEKVLAAAGIDKTHPYYSQFYAQTLSTVHHGRQYSANEDVVAQKIIDELQKPDITPQQMQKFAFDYRDEMIENQQANASGSTFDNRDQSAPTLRQQINNTLKSGVELRRQINPDYPEIFYNDKGQLEDIIVDLSKGSENSAVGIINSTIAKYKKFGVDFDAEANQFLIKGKPVNVQKFFKGKQEQLEKFLNKIKSEPESFDAADHELFSVISGGNYAKFTELKMIRGKAGDKRNLALRNALNDEILFNRFSEEMNGKNFDFQTVAANAENLSKDYAGKSSIIAKESERGKISSTGEDLSANEIDRIEFSVRPSELAKQSTYQNWKSCMNAVGLNHRYVDDSIGQGSIIAYGFNSKNPQKKISRLLLHPYINGEGKTLYIPNDRLYGESNSAFVNAVTQFAEHINEGKEGIFKFNANKVDGTDGLYNDNSLVGNNRTTVMRGNAKPNEELLRLYGSKDAAGNEFLDFTQGTLKHTEEPLLSLYTGDIQTSKETDIFGFSKLNKVNFMADSYYSNHSAIPVNELNIPKCKDIDISDASGIKKINIGDDSELSHIVICNNPELASSVLTKERIAKAVEMGTDDYSLAQRITENGQKMETFAYKGKIEKEGLSFDNCPNLKSCHLNDVNACDGILDFSACKNLTSIVGNGNCKVNKIIVPDYFYNIWGIDNAEVLYADKGKIVHGADEIRNRDDLTKITFMDMKDPDAVIDLSKCKDLEKINFEGECNFKELIVPQGFDAGKCSGLNNVNLEALIRSNLLMEEGYLNGDVIAKNKRRLRGKLNYQGNVKVKNSYDLRLYDQLNKVLVEENEIYLENLNVEHLFLNKPTSIAFDDSVRINEITIKDKSDINSVIVFGNPQISSEILTPDIFSRLKTFATDEVGCVSQVLKQQNDNLETFMIKGSALPPEGINLDNCPNLKAFGVMNMDNPDAVIDLSKCKNLEMLGGEGSVNVKRIIVPDGFDKSKTEGLSGVEILTAGEAKAKDLLTQMRTKPNTEGTEQQATKMDKFMALRGLVNSQQNIFDKRMPQTQNQNEAEQRIQQMLIRKRQIAACYA